MRTTCFLPVALLAALGLALSPALAPAQCVAPPPGLVSWWPGDGDASDFIGENDGTLQNGATFDSGFVTSGNGQGFSFDGVDDFAEVADAPSLDIVGEITIEAWVLITAETPLHKGYDLVEKQGPGDSTNYRFGIARAIGGTPSRTLFFWNGTTFRLGTGRVPINEFTHIAMTVNRTDLRFYIDGVLDSSHTMGLGSVTAGPLLIGRDNLGGYFRGKIDELGIYNRALSPGEIQAIFDAGSAGKCKGPQDPVQALVDLIEDLALLDLQYGIQNNLDAKIAAALQALLDVMDNNDVAAIRALNAFINVVQAQSGAKIDAAEADALIADAQAIINLLSG